MADPGSDRSTAFDRLFAEINDPWDLETSEYEREKRQRTLATLGSRRFSSGLEIGCATGVLTAELAGRCDRLLAVDVSETALKRAKERLGSEPHVTFERRELPSDWPGGHFDLIVLSEVLYFLSEGEIRQISRTAMASLSPGGLCLLVNWTGENNLPVDGTRAGELFISESIWRKRSDWIGSKYRIDLLEAGGS